MFTAAGKLYLTIAQLKVKNEAEVDGGLYRGHTVPLYRDLYGRQVLHLRERFPCFDVYDRLNEDRYYHWYAIRHENGITLVYTQDDKPGAQVHEDYRPGVKTAFYAPSWLCEAMTNAGFFQKEE